MIELADGAPLPVGELAPNAPSNTLPAYATNFRALDGRTFGPTPRFGPAEDGMAHVLPKPHFVNGRLTQPEVVEVAVPRGAAGSVRTMHDVPAGVITPLERREAMAFERCLQRARSAHRAEKSEAVRRVLLARATNPRGLAGVEAPGTAGTRLYAGASAALAAEAAGAASRAAARADYLRGRINSDVGHPLLEHAGEGGAAPERLFQSRARTAHSSDGWSGRGESYAYAPSAQLAPVRQTGNNQERPLRPPNAARAQALWNAREGGRNFDIISGVEKSLRCTAPETIDMRRAHESIVAAAEARDTVWAGGLGRHAPGLRP